MTAEIETVILLQFTVPFPADFLVLNFQDDSLIDSGLFIIDVGDFHREFKDRFELTAGSNSDRRSTHW